MAVHWDHEAVGLDVLERLEGHGKKIAAVNIVTVFDVDDWHEVYVSELVNDYSWLLLAGSHIVLYGGDQVPALPRS